MAGMWAPSSHRDERSSVLRVCPRFYAGRVNLQNFSIEKIPLVLDFFPRMLLVYMICMAMFGNGVRTFIVDMHIKFISGKTHYIQVGGQVM
jgi:hypothetical protein